MLYQLILSVLIFVKNFIRKVRKYTVCEEQKLMIFKWWEWLDCKVHK